MNTAVGYTRVSTARQAEEDKVSLSEQQQDIEAYCASRGYTIAAWYQDVGSGASKHRPDFQRMLKDAQAGQFDVIVCWKSDRLSRGLYPATALMEAIEGADVAIEAVKDSIDLNTFGLLAAVGKIELDNIRERVRMGVRGKVKSGTLSGVVKYGYRLEGEKKHKVPVIDEAEAQVVHRIFAEFINGAGCQAIAGRLVADGVPTRKGNKWERTTVWGIVKSPTYIGAPEYGRIHFVKKDIGGREVQHKKRVTDPSKWLTVEFPPIIDKATWNLAQAELRNPTRQARKYGRKHNATHLLRGVLWCSHCGNKYTIAAGYRIQYYTKKDETRTRRQTDTMVRRYVCPNGIKPGRDCPRPRIYSTSIEPHVWKAATDFLTNPEQAKALIRERQRYLEEGGTLAQLAKVHEQRTEAEAERSRATFQHQKGYITDTELDLRMRQIEEVKEHYVMEGARLETEAAGITTALARLEDFVSTAQDIVKRLASMTDTEKAELVRQLVRRITVSEEGIHIAMALDNQRGLIVSNDNAIPITSLEIARTAQHRVGSSPVIPRYASVIEAVKR